MELLRQRILKDGRALSDQVLLVDSFLKGHIHLNAMADAVTETMERTADSIPTCLEDIYEAERAARELARSILHKYTR